MWLLFLDIITIIQIPFIFIGILHIYSFIKNFIELSKLYKQYGNKRPLNHLNVYQKHPLLQVTTFPNYFP
jgi:predicted metallopeptidase